MDGRTGAPSDDAACTCRQLVFVFNFIFFQDNRLEGLETGGRQRLFKKKKRKMMPKYEEEPVNAASLEARVCPRTERQPARKRLHSHKAHSKVLTFALVMQYVPPFGNIIITLKNEIYFKVLN